LHSGARKRDPGGERGRRAARTRFYFPSRPRAQRVVGRGVGVGGFVSSPTPAHFRCEIRRPSPPLSRGREKQSCAARTVLFASTSRKPEGTAQEFRMIWLTAMPGSGNCPNPPPGCFNFAFTLHSNCIRNRWGQRETGDFMRVSLGAGMRGWMPVGRDGENSRRQRA